MTFVDDHINLSRRKGGKADHTGAVEFYLSDDVSLEVQDVHFVNDYSAPLDLPYPKMFLSGITQPLITSSFKDDTHGKTSHTHSLFCQELSPGRHLFEMFTSIPSRGMTAVVQMDWSTYLREAREHPPNGNGYCIAYTFFKALLALIDDNHRAVCERTSTTKRRVKGKTLPKYTPQRVVYLSANKSEPSAQRTGLTFRRWDESWRVRGHWRKVKTIGKNRAGDRCVPGYTWVNDHVKGDGEVSKKRYVIT